MTSVDKTIYKICREAAGLTQERAAELLPCSVRALARYESLEVQVPDDVAYRMVILYNSQYLAVQHLRYVSQLAASIIPAVEDCSLQTATIRLVNRVLDFAEHHRDRQLLKIAEDGVIDQEEQPLFDTILDELEDLVAASTEVRLAQEHGKE